MNMFATGNKPVRTTKPQQGAFLFALSALRGPCRPYGALLALRGPCRPYGALLALRGPCRPYGALLALRGPCWPYGHLACSYLDFATDMV